MGLFKKLTLSDQIIWFLSDTVSFSEKLTLSDQIMWVSLRKSSFLRENLQIMCESHCIIFWIPKWPVVVP